MSIIYIKNNNIYLIFIFQVKKNSYLHLNLLKMNTMRLLPPVPKFDLNNC